MVSIIIPRPEQLLSNVRQLVVVKSLNIILLHQGVDVLLDVGYLWRETIAYLIDDFLDEVDVLELLATFHDSDDHGLRRISDQNGGNEWLIQTWSNNFLSSSIVL